MCSRRAGCRLRVGVSTADGWHTSACWYRAVYEADDPLDVATVEMFEAKTEAELADCLSKL